MLLLCAFYLWQTPAAAHPLHLSVTNIIYDNGKLVMSMKTFRDDWEVAYFHFHGSPIDFTRSENRNLPWFKAYLTRHFRIEAGAEHLPLSLQLDTIVLEGESMQIDISAELSPEANSLYIYNSLLSDIFPDQTNLVIFSYGGKETGIKFDLKKQQAEVILK